MHEQPPMPLINPTSSAPAAVALLTLIDVAADARAWGLLRYVIGRFAPIYVQLKLDHDHRLIFIAARSQGVDASDRVNAFFNFFRNFTLNDFR